jgi:BRCT domain type II-containing protein
LRLYTSIASNPAYPKSVQEAAKTRLEAIQKQMEFTPAQKDYNLSRRQGGTETFDEWQAKNEQRKTAATEEAKLGAKKYESWSKTAPRRRWRFRSSICSKSR